MELPPDIPSEHAEAYRGKGITLEKFILDIHTGKIMGLPGTLLYDPRTGQKVQKHKSISVIAKTAAMADALSTGFMALDREKIHVIQSAIPKICGVYIS